MKISEFSFILFQKWAFLKIILMKFVITKRLTFWFYTSHWIDFVTLFTLFITVSVKYENNICECIPRYLQTCRHSHFPLPSQTICVVGSANYHLRMIKEIYVSFLLLFQQKYLDKKIHHVGGRSVVWIQVLSLTPYTVRRQQTLST